MRSMVEGAGAPPVASRHLPRGAGEDHRAVAAKGCPTSARSIVTSRKFST